MRRITLPDAIQSLRPGAQWVLRGDDYSGLEWKSDGLPPTEQELALEVDRLQKAADAVAYRDMRRKEYPPVEDYLDAVVKGDSAAVQAYIDACNAVKAKYPKPA